LSDSVGFAFGVEFIGVPFRPMAPHHLLPLVPAGSGQRYHMIE
jgi:hypothetical protein